VADTSELARVSGAERQFVVDRLRDETAAGRMSIEEFERRAGRVYAARTRDQLLTLLPSPEEAAEVEGDAGGITVTLPTRRWRPWRWRR
jgi:hypothetical protein